MLYIESSPDTFTRWTGGTIDGILLPKPATVEANWSVPELEAVGLWRSSDMIGAAEAIPEGHVKTVESVQRVEGVVRFVYAYEEAPAPVPPSVVSMRQARLALLGAGLLSQVEAALDALDEPQRSIAMIEWEYATELRRDHALVAALAPALNLDDNALDNLFMAAAAIA